MPPSIVRAGGGCWRATERGLECLRQLGGVPVDTRDDQTGLLAALPLAELSDAQLAARAPPQAQIVSRRDGNQKYPRPRIGPSPSLVTWVSKRPGWKGFHDRRSKVHTPQRVSAPV